MLPQHHEDARMAQRLHSKTGHGADSLAGKPSRFLMDASYTLGTSRISGIERVVRNLRDGCEQRATSQGIRAVTLISHHGRFFEVGQSQQEALARLASIQGDIVQALPAAYRRMLSPVIRLSGSRRLKKWFLPDAGHMGVFRLGYRVLYQTLVRRICQSARECQPAQGDLLVMPDAYWTRREVWPAAAAARARGAMIAAVVYDLIPLTHPQFVGERRRLKFADYIRQLATHADVILTISDAVHRELLATLPELMGNMPYCHDIRSFPLGAEFAEVDGEADPRIQALFSGESRENPFVTVAAFDPRKNHHYLLDAFELLWQTHPETKLCLVGRVGSRCQDVLDRINSHPRLGKQLFTFHDLNDVDLQHCYRACQGVIFPSIVEGFGLPIVEGLWHGKPLYASDTPIHREVGGSQCDYFDLAQPQSLVELLQSRIGKSLIQHSGTPMRPRSWSQSIDVFYNHCLSAYQRTTASAPLARSA